MLIYKLFPMNILYVLCVVVGQILIQIKWTF